MTYRKNTCCRSAECDFSASYSSIERGSGSRLQPSWLLHFCCHAEQKKQEIVPDWALKKNYPFCSLNYLRWSFPTRRTKNPQKVKSHVFCWCHSVVCKNAEPRGLRRLYLPSQKRSFAEKRKRPSWESSTKAKKKDIITLRSRTIPTPSQPCFPLGTLRAMLQLSPTPSVFSTNPMVDVEHFSFQRLCAKLATGARAANVKWIYTRSRVECFFRSRTIHAPELKSFLYTFKSKKPLL